MLPRNVSLGVGLATVVVVFAIFQNATPPLTDIRAADPFDPDIEASERLATWTSAGTVAAVSLIARDPTIFILGGAATVAMAWWHRHADAVNPITGSAATLPLQRDEAIEPVAVTVPMD